MNKQRHLVLHVDGSSMVPKGTKTHVFGWGLVALHDDTHTECHGHIVSPVNSGLNGHHEQIAFVQGVLLARELGFGGQSWSGVSIFCDDLIFGSAPSHLHKDNFAPTRADQIHACLSRVTQLCFDQKAHDLTLDALMHARIVKVKGHSLHVYQERVDNLAKFGARQGAGIVGMDEQPASMDDWLETGITTYANDSEAQRAGRAAEFVKSVWRAPFVPEKPVHSPG
jgi:hypothetical protein